MDWEERRSDSRTPWGEHYRKENIIGLHSRYLRGGNCICTNATDKKNQGQKAVIHTWSNRSFATNSSNPCGSGRSRRGEGVRRRAEMWAVSRMQTLSPVSVRYPGWRSSVFFFAELDDPTSQENVRLLWMVRSWRDYTAIRQPNGGTCGPQLAIHETMMHWCVYGSILGTKRDA
jgi:hypothetical protein